jgi:chromatin remodeling complex protein RSC6
MAKDTGSKTVVSAKDTNTNDKKPTKRKQASEPKADPKVDSKVEMKAEPKAESKAEPKAEPKAELKAEPKAAENNKSTKNKDRRGIPEELERELKFKTALNELRNEITSQTKVLKDLKSGVKKLEVSYQHDINKAVKSKRRKSGPSKPTGFVKELELSKDLADLIGVTEGTKISMPTYTKKFYEMLKRENLFYEGDGRVLRANDKIKKVFNLPDSVNQSIDHKDKNGFNFYTLQKHIASVNKKLSKQ